MTTAKIYWIRLLEHTDISTQGYVGVSINPKKRFATHKNECISKKHANPHLIHAFEKYGVESMILEEYFLGPKEECYKKEAELRPTINIGWNVAPGGHRGPGWVNGRSRDARGGRATLKQQPNRPLCELCNSTPVKKNGKSKHGFTQWHKYCATCSKIAYDDQYKYLKNKKLVCDCCNFQAKDICQMELVYNDGNKKNKIKSNIKTYCSNCYKLYKKTLKIKKLLNITVDSDIII